MFPATIVINNILEHDFVEQHARAINLNVGRYSLADQCFSEIRPTITGRNNNNHVIVINYIRIHMDYPM